MLDVMHRRSNAARLSPRAARPTLPVSVAKPLRAECNGAAHESATTPSRSKTMRTSRTWRPRFRQESGSTPSQLCC